MGEDLVETEPHDHQVQQQVSPDYEDGDAYGLLEPLEEDRAKDCKEYQRYEDLLLVQ